jgi:hypothetical protein
MKDNEKVQLWLVQAIVQATSTSLFITLLHENGEILNLEMCVYVFIMTVINATGLCHSFYGVHFFQEQFV